MARPRKYPDEIRLRAQGLLAGRLSPREVARRLDLPESTIRQWAKDIDRRALAVRLVTEEGWTRRDAAERLGVHPKTVRRWIGEPSRGPSEHLLPSPLERAVLAESKDRFIEQRSAYARRVREQIEGLRSDLLSAALADLAEGWGYREVATAYGVSASTLKKAGR